MTNPYQHGSSGFPDPNNASGTSSSGLGTARRFSYASVADRVGPSASGSGFGSGVDYSGHSGGAVPHYPGGMRGSGSHFTAYQAGTEMASYHQGSSRGGGMDLDGVDRHGSGGGHNGATRSSRTAGWAAGGSQQLPSFSRAYNLFMGRPSAVDGETIPSGGSGAGGPTGSVFFVPSYLRGSTYMHKLEEMHRARLAAQREHHHGPGSAGAGAGAGLAASTSSANLPTKQPGMSIAPGAGSHRGLSYDVVEKPPPVYEDDDATAPPLPTRWNKDDKYGGLEVLGDGLEVKYTAPRGPNEPQHEACAIRADHAMPPQCGIYYYEVTILSGKRDDTTIAIGFSSRSVALSRAPGWEPESWGYHGDDGNSFAAQNSGKHYGPSFTTGDTVGCGVNFRTGTAFFTKNGMSLGVAFRDVRGLVYPSIGLKKTGEHIRVNFGQTPFVFDIDSLMKREKESIEQEIAKANTTKLVPGLSETALIQQLVLQFLQHDGYIETARAFAEEIQTETKNLSVNAAEVEDTISIKDDEDANNRQRIRRAILEGDIDKALKLTKAYYPHVLQDNEQVYFKLKCRKFIEMVRTAAEMKQMPERLRNGHNIKSSPIEINSTEMDVDTNGHDNGSWEGMDTEAVGQHSDKVRDLEIQTMIYGQDLSAEFGSDVRKEVINGLQDIYALMAYDDPFESPQKHLLDRKERVAVAEELNSAILSSLGRSSRASLEKLYAQTTVLLEELRQNGGPGAFVSLKEVIDEIPKPHGF